MESRSVFVRGSTVFLGPTLPPCILGNLRFIDWVGFGGFDDQLGITHRIHGTGIFTYIYMVDFYGFHAGIYTIDTWILWVHGSVNIGCESPMDPAVVG